MDAEPELTLDEWRALLPQWRRAGGLVGAVLRLDEQRRAQLQELRDAVNVLEARLSDLQNVVAGITRA
jgi:cell division protein FtsB